MELSNLFEHFLTCYETYLEKETTENFRWRYHLKIVCVTKTWGNSRNKQNKAALVLKNSELLQKIIYEINNPQFMKIRDFLITTKLTSKIRHVWDNCYVWDKLAYKANIKPLD